MRSQPCLCHGPRLACPSWGLSLRTWRTCTAATRYIQTQSGPCTGPSIPYFPHLPLLLGSARPGAIPYLFPLCSQKLQQELEFLEVQEEYIKDEQKNLKKEFLHAQEEVKRIQSIPLVIGQFLEAVDQNTAIVGSTTGAWGVVYSSVHSTAVNCFLPRVRNLQWQMRQDSVMVFFSVFLSLMQKWKYILRSLSFFLYVCVYNSYSKSLTKR